MNSPSHYRRIHSSRRRQSEGGYALIAVTIVLVVLLGFAGLAMDASYLEHVKRRIQTAADAGAMAGAQAILRKKTDAEIVTEARADTTLNGYTSGARNSTVTVNHPPASGRYAGDAKAVEVIVQQTNQPLWFMNALKVSAATVAARAVAHLGAGDGCLYSLNPNKASSFEVAGGAKVTVDCAILVDSSSNRALVVNGSPNNGPAITAAEVGVVGGVDAKPGMISPAAVTGLLPSPDPLASLPSPSVSSCDYTKFKVTDGATLSPGTYCGGIDITSQNVRFLPGNYIMAGGGLSISGGSANGTGVMFYDTQVNGFAYDPITISGNASVNFSAPTSGDYAGILFYNDRSLNLNGSNYTNNITGGANSKFDGVMYFPNGQVIFTGTTGTTGSNTLIIADTVKLAGTPTFSGNFSALPGGDPVKAAVLGE